MTSTISTKAKWSVHCPTALSSDSAPSFLVSATDGTRYLFGGCPENFLRAATQDRVPVRKIKAVFLSSAVDVATTAGLGGLLLTLGDQEGARLLLNGPDGTAHLVASMRFHTRRQKLSLPHWQYPKAVVSRKGKSTDGRDEPAFRDENITVWAEPVLPEGWRSSSSDKAKAPKRRPRSTSTSGETPGGRRGPRSTSPISKAAKLGAEGLKASVTLTSESLSNYLISEPVLNIERKADTSTSQRPEQDRADHESSEDKKADELDWFSRDFEPSELEASDAHTWRSMVVDDMFRGGRPYEPIPEGSQWIPSPAWKHTPLPAWRGPPQAVSYLVAGPAVRGQFLPDEAKKQGIKPGPDFARIAAREQLFRADGTPVDIDKCFTPGALTAAFAIIYCPSTDFIAMMLARNPLRNLQPSHDLKYMFHYLGPGVLESEVYRNWLAFLPRSIKHIIAAPGYTADQVTFASAAILQLRLSRMDKRIFSLPQYELEATVKMRDVSGLLSNVTPMNMGEAFQLGGGKTRLDDPPTRMRTFDFLPESDEARTAEAKLTDISTAAAKLHSKETWAEYLRLTKIAQAAIAKEESSRSARGLGQEPGDSIRVTPLGTGSAVPSKYRNVSSTVLTLRPHEVVLLDAGEGTAGQLARHYGQSGLGYFYRQLTFIFISHMHADHHAGLAAVLAARAVALDPTANPHLDADALAKTLYIACPRGVTTYIRDLAALHALKLDDERAPVIFIDNECFTAERLTTSRLGDKDLAAFREALDIKWVQTVHVEHRTRAYGLVLIGKKGWKVVYSGDTQPCQALVRAGDGATLLIHEATIEDDKPEMAARKGHSTFAQAIQVAKDMKAKHCLLTHFSQRYPKFPPLSDTEDDTSPNASQVAVAFDLMSIQVKDFWKFRHFIKPFECLFSEMEADDGNDGFGDAAEEDQKTETECNSEHKKIDVKSTGKQKAKASQQKQKEQAANNRKDKKGKASNGSVANLV